VEEQAPAVGDALLDGEVVVTVTSLPGARPQA
jgi:hypothetical protein